MAYKTMGEVGVVFFTGSHHHTIDSKGRVSVPAPFRKNGKSKSFMLFRGMETCLFLFPAEAYHRMLGERFARPMIENRAMRTYQRILGPNTREVTPDKLGRITISPELLQMGGLERDALIIGAINWIEIWDPGRYRFFEEEHSFKDAAAEAFRWLQEARSEDT